MLEKLLQNISDSRMWPGHAACPGGIHYVQGCNFVQNLFPIGKLIGFGIGEKKGGCWGKGIMSLVTKRLLAKGGPCSLGL